MADEKKDGKSGGVVKNSDRRAEGRLERLSNVSDTLRPPSKPPPAPDDKEKRMSIVEKVHELLFAVRRSVRYHNRRVRFLDVAQKALTIISFAGGLGAFVLLMRMLDETGTLAAIFAAVSASASLLNLVARFAERARLHSDLARQFITLEKDIVAAQASAEAAAFVEFTRRRLDIEANEPPILRVLDILCHNEQLRAMGYPWTEQVKVAWYQRLFAPVWDIGSHSISAA